MWIIFSVLSLICYAITDIIGKKHTENRDAIASLKLIASANSVGFVLSIFLYAFNVGGSGQAPWQLLFSYPLISISALCHSLYWMFFLFSLRYLTLSVNEALQGTYGAFYFFGLLLVNICFNRLTRITQMLHPLRIVPVIITILFTALLPNLQVIKNSIMKKTTESARLQRKNILFGMILLLFSVLFDAFDSVISTLVLEESGVSSVDFMKASYFSFVLPFIVLFAYISIKEKRIFVPFKDNSKITVLYTIPALFSSILYIVACSFDTVKTGILFIAYPVVPIIFARLFLKEKNTHLQNVCLWIITLSAIFFCIADSLLQI